MCRQMKKLSYAAIENGTDYYLRQAPERVLQFGDGNFLRAFCDCFIDIMNQKAGFNGKVVVVPPASTGKTGRINEQQGLYQLFLRGKVNGSVLEERRLVSCISRAVDVFTQWDELLQIACQPELQFVISNTTEAGITYDPSCHFDDLPPRSFPAKVTRLLWERWRSGASGWTFFPCELIEHNGQTLREMVLLHAREWGLEDEFQHWVEKENQFYDTLVDRIVTGYPATWAQSMDEKNGYVDALMNTAEPFGLWAIAAPETLQNEFPAPQVGLPVHFVEDLRPFEERKVRILNGGHTAMAAAAFLSGHDIVRTCIRDPTVREFLRGAIYQEIIPTLSADCPQCVEFAEAVEDRFANPYIDHKLLDISLNSVSKWKTRILPSVKAYCLHHGYSPRRLTFSFAALATFYTQGSRDGTVYPVRDDQKTLAYFSKKGNTGTLIRDLAGQTDFWGEDLGDLPGFIERAEEAADWIHALGMARAIAKCNEECAYEIAAH